MYWNCWSVTHRLSRRQGLIETWDVLKFVFACRSGLQIPINRNMRCIEIPLRRATVEHPLRLIETWDVLKSEFAFPPLGGVFTINRNMRCIEIRYFSLHIHPVTRLIETWDVLKFSQPRTRHASVVGLIETWDVLKSTTPWQKRTLNRLIETWDVLKCYRMWPIRINRNMRCIEMQTHLPTLASVFLINRNMRCIEMQSSSIGEVKKQRLIETWDVLKSVLFQAFFLFPED